MFMFKSDHGQSHGYGYSDFKNKKKKKKRPYAVPFGHRKWSQRGYNRKTQPRYNRNAPTIPGNMLQDTRPPNRGWGCMIMIMPHAIKIKPPNPNLPVKLRLLFASSWKLAFGFWCLAFGFWLLAFGFLDSGFWILDFGFWLFGLPSRLKGWDCITVILNLLCVLPNAS